MAVGEDTKMDIFPPTEEEFKRVIQELLDYMDLNEFMRYFKVMPRRTRG